MKILHIYKNYFPIMGGIENYIKILADSHAAAGHQVTVLATSPTRQTTVEQIDDVTVVKAAPVATIARTPMSLSMIPWCRRLEADVVHLHFPYPMGEFANYFFGRSRRVVITYHADIVKQKYLLRVYRPILDRVLASADRIIATSPPYIETSPFLQKVRNRCVVVPLGIDISRFESHNDARAEEVRKQHGGERLVLFVGRLRYFKGLQYMIKAMKLVEGKLLIVGTGPEEAPLKALVREEGLDAKVTFVGDVPDEALPAYYHACDLFVLPSSHRSEAFGTVLIEAMAAGKAVVSTELGTGTSYVNLDRETGLVVAPRDPAALAEAVNRLLRDAGMRARFERAALSRAAEFSRDRLVERVMSLYQEVAAPSFRR